MASVAGLCKTGESPEAGTLSRVPGYVTTAPARGWWSSCWASPPPASAFCAMVEAHKSRWGLGQGARIMAHTHLVLLSRGVRSPSRAIHAKIITESWSETFNNPCQKEWKSLINVTFKRVFASSFPSSWWKWIGICSWTPRFNHHGVVGTQLHSRKFWEDPFP